MAALTTRGRNPLAALRLLFVALRVLCNAQGLRCPSVPHTCPGGHTCPGPLWGSARGARGALRGETPSGASAVWYDGGVSYIHGSTNVRVLSRALTWDSVING
jgi:hypothetical protein